MFEVAIPYEMDENLWVDMKGLYDINVNHVNWIIVMLLYQLTKNKVRHVDALVLCIVSCPSAGMI